MSTLNISLPGEDDANHHAAGLPASTASADEHGAHGFCLRSALTELEDAEQRIAAEKSRLQAALSEVDGRYQAALNREAEIV